MSDGWWSGGESLVNNDDPTPASPQPSVFVGESLVQVRGLDGEWLDVGRIRDAILHTEIIETEEADLIASPGQLWIAGREGAVVTGEITLPEHQFWQVVDLVCGPVLAAEIRQDVEDVLRWEGEGGSCMLG